MYARWIEFIGGVSGRRTGVLKREREAQTRWLGLERNGGRLLHSPTTSTCYNFVFFLPSSFNSIFTTPTLNFISTTAISRGSPIFMAACSFGASSLRIYEGPARIESTNLQKNSHSIRLSNSSKFDGLMLSQRSGKASNRCLCLPAKNAQSGTDLEAYSKVEKSSESTSQLTPNASHVESLLTQICDSTSIAEVEIKLGGFRLYVLRDLTGQITTPPPPVTAPVTGETVEAIDQNGSASSTSLAITKAVPTSGGIQTFLDRAADDGLVIVQSPRVGYFRRSRAIKGKRAPPSCKEKQIVKEGQVICYVEQLGGDLPIESDVGGEVIKILRDDGEPVGYGDALIAILPSFPGIKKLQ
ncbi:hypothetical protein L2E82_02457 [Cichorium intybus]|uniref:Uncharacterized protein n=1 Tax=Cichorium intybus TaxID=13427 RepID=A0ACB9H304_CICIN|nr:hypothetical protein L2E82_02457 [Cichorium intybus]